MNEQELEGPDAVVEFLLFRFSTVTLKSLRLLVDTTFNVTSNQHSRENDDV